MDILRQSSSTRENLSLLSVMEALEDGEQITQRELARTTGLNLKKVNYCLHELLEKGYIKFQRVRKNTYKRSYLYILTPAGLKAKSQLTYGFLKFTLDLYNKMEDKLRLCLMVTAKAGVERVVLYGASDVARILLELTKDFAPEVVGVMDGNYQGQDFHGVPVLEEGLHDVAKWDGVLITKLEEIDEAEIHLHQLGIPKKSIWKLV